MEPLMTDKNVVIRRSLPTNILVIIACIAFTAMFILMLHIETDISYQMIAIVGIIFFGGGGILYLAFMSWKPIVVISNEGIIVPYGWGKNEVSWRNVRRFQIVEQRIGGSAQKYIGIFVFDRNGIMGAGKASRAIIKGVTRWQDPPDLLIAPAFSSKAQTKKIINALQEYHNAYKNRRV